MAQIKPLAEPALIFLSKSQPAHYSSSSSSSSLCPLDSHYYNNSHNKHSLCRDAMRRRLLRSNLLLAFATVAFFAFLSLHLSRNAAEFHFSASAAANLHSRKSDHHYNLAIREDAADLLSYHHVRRVSYVPDSNAAAVSILLADWEVLVIINPVIRSGSGDDYVCVFQNNATSPARFSGEFPSTNRTAFKCTMPSSVRRLRPFFMPVLTEKDESPPSPPAQMPELHRWNFLVYESFSTEKDVVLFVKGVNNRQGINRSPNDFRCVFHNDDATVAVKTAVTSSAQEVFRCRHPKLTAMTGLTSQPISVSLEISNENLVVPSVAQYSPQRSVTNQEPKSLLCACAMVYNAGKFLKEWVMYHSKIGVDKFILYDNDSHDNLRTVVDELNGDGYDVTTLFWVWPKTQEAGFSHGAVYAKDSCTWMMYVDVDEFVFSPSWTSSSRPSHNMLKSLLPRTPQPSQPPSSASDRLVGQVSIRCNEFGPSNQRAHPIAGVTQGYSCRRIAEQRHKSILLLDAVDTSLLNVIHHFHLDSKYYKTKTVSMERAVVNHYKYQAWTEFRNKFRRRVSAYVADWKEKVNPASKDRTPGLGFEPIEPQGWARRFCEVRDERLKMLTRRWFGAETSHGYKMAWEI